MDDWRKSVSSALRATEENLQNVRSSGFASLPAGASNPFSGPTQKRPLFEEVAKQRDDGQQQGAALVVRQYGEAINALRSQLKSHTAELELERTVREDAVRELSRRTAHEVGELREIIRQLRNDNVELKRSMYDVERRAQSQHQQRKDESFGADGSAGAHHGLIPRVSELEATAARQQRVLEDRTRRLDVLVRDTVNAKVDEEIERMRSVAREAARDSAEELVKLRFQAMQAMLAADGQAISAQCQRATEQSADNERQAARHREELGRQMMLLGQRVDSAMEGREKWMNVSSEVHQLVRSQLDSERTRIDDTLAFIKAEMAALSRKQSTEALDVQHALQHYVTQRMDVLTAQSITRDDVTRLLQQSSNTTENELGSVRKSLLTHKQMLDETRQDLNKFAALSDSQLLEVRKLVDDALQSRAAEQQTISRFSVDVEDMRSKVRSATTKSDDFAIRVLEVSSSLQQLQLAHGDVVAEVKAAVEANDARTQRYTEQTKKFSEALERHKDSIGRLDEGVAAVSTRLDQETVKNATIAERSTKALEACQGKLQAVSLAASDAQADAARTAHEVAGTKAALETTSRRVTTNQQEIERRVAAVREELTNSVADVQRDVEQVPATLKETIRQAISRSEERVLSSVEAIVDEKLANVTAAGAKGAVVGTASSNEQSKSAMSASRLTLLEDEVKVLREQHETLATTSHATQKSLDDFQHRQKALLERTVNELSQVISQKTAALSDDLAADRRSACQRDESLRLSLPALVLKHVEQHQQEAQEHTVDKLFLDLTQRLQDHFAAVSHSHKELTQFSATLSVQQRKLAEVAARQDTLESQHASTLAQCNALDERLTSFVVQSRSLERRSASQQAQSVTAATGSSSSAVFDESSAKQSLARLADELAAIKKRVDEQQRNGDENADFDERLQQLQAAVESIHEVLEAATSCFVATLQSSEADQDKVDAEQIQSLPNVVCFLLQRIGVLDETVSTVGSNLLAAVDVVQRHESGVAAIGELVHAIAFNARNIVTLAEAVGLEKDAFTLKLNYPSDFDPNAEEEDGEQQELHDSEDA